MVGSDGGLARLDREAVGLLRDQLRDDLRASAFVSLALAAGSLWYDTPWGLVLSAGIAAMCGVRQLALPAISRGNSGNALAFTAAGTWGIAIIVVWIVPLAMPLMILNLVSPLINASTYLSEDRTRRFTTASVGVAVSLGLLGYLQDGKLTLDDVPKWFVSMFIIVTLVGHVSLVARNIRASTRVRVEALNALVHSRDELGLLSDDLRESRRRVVLAADRERVRIERNIHDGAQQNLISLAIRLDLAAQAVAQGTPIDAESLQALHAGTHQAIGELRDLAHGIYPPLLAHRGLRDALVSAASRSSQLVHVHVPVDLELDSEQQVAIYFVCLEALQNATKHGGDGAEISIEITHTDGELTIEVRDNGAGFDADDAAPSRGLLNMADRVGALGGELVIESSPGAGALVRAVIPASLM